MSDLYGWFDDCYADKPAYDPPHNAPCPYCGDPMNLSDIRTHSFVAASGGTRSYFYRTHRTCDTAATDGAKQSILGGVIELVTVCEGTRP